MVNTSTPPSVASLSSSVAAASAGDEVWEISATHLTRSAKKKWKRQKQLIRKQKNVFKTKLYRKRV